MPGRADALVQRLVDVDVRDSLVVIEQMQPYRNLVAPRLHERLAAAADRTEEIKLRLALMPDEAAAQLPALTRQLGEAQVDEVPVICRALKGYRDQVTATLWENLLSAGTPQNPGRVLPSAAGLATFAPQDERWHQAKTVVADTLVSVDPRFLAWMEAPRPAGNYLIEPLANTFYENSPQSASRTRQATVALSQYLAGDQEKLIELLLDADAEQFRQLFPSVARHGDKAVTVLTEILSNGKVRQDQPPAFESAEATPDAESMRQLEQAGGTLTSRYAFCTSLTVEDFRRIAARLDSLGYCPKRVRPYNDQETIRVAATWSRDGLAWQWHTGVTAEDVAALDVDLQEQGFFPSDACGFTDVDATGSATDRFAVLWTRPETPPTKSLLCLGETRDELEKLDFPSRQGVRYAMPSESPLREGFIAQSLQVHQSTGGTQRYTVVWWQTPASVALAKRGRRTSELTIDGEEVLDHAAWDVDACYVVPLSLDNILAWAKGRQDLYGSFFRSRANYLLGQYEPALNELHSIVAQESPQLSQWAPWPVNVGRVSFDGLTNRHGTRSACLELASPAYAWLEQDVTVQPRRYHLLSGWIKPEALRQGVRRGASWCTLECAVAGHGHAVRPFHGRLAVRHGPLQFRQSEPGSHPRRHRRPHKQLHRKGLVRRSLPGAAAGAATAGAARFANRSS